MQLSELNQKRGDNPTEKIVRARALDFPYGELGDCDLRSNNLG